MLFKIMFVNIKVTFIFGNCKSVITTSFRLYKFKDDLEIELDHCNRLKTQNNIINWQYGGTTSSGTNNKYLNEKRNSAAITS